MADSPISGLGENTSPASNDWLATVDVSDTTQSPNGTSKKMLMSKLLQSANNLSDLANALTAIQNLGLCWKKIDHQTASSSSLLGFTGLSGYATMRITFEQLVPATNAVDLVLQSGSGSYDTNSNYVWAILYGITGVGSGYSTGTAASGFMNTYDNTAGIGMSGQLIVTNFNVASSYARWCGNLIGRRGTIDSLTVNSVIHTPTTIGSSIRDRMKFYFSSGNISSGSILLEALV